MQRNKQKYLGVLLIAAVAATIIYLGAADRDTRPGRAGEFKEPVIRTYKTYPSAYPAELKKEIVEFSAARTAIYPDGRLETTLQYQSANLPERVLDLYKQSLAENGWTVAESRDQEQAALLTGTRQQEEVVFRLSASSAPITQVEASYKASVNR